MLPLPVHLSVKTVRVLKVPADAAVQFHGRLEPNTHMVMRTNKVLVVAHVAQIAYTVTMSTLHQIPKTCVLLLPCQDYVRSSINQVRKQMYATA